VTYKTPPKLVETMGQARAELLEMLSGWSQAQGAFKPSPEKWSTSEILEPLRQ